MRTRNTIKKLILLLGVVVSFIACSNTGASGSSDVCMQPDASPNDSNWDCEYKAVKRGVAGPSGWYQGAIYNLKAPNQDTAIGRAAAWVTDHDLVPVWVDCKLSTWGNDATLEAAFGSTCPTCVSSGTDCTACTDNAVTSACFGQNSICASDPACSACLACLDDGGAVVTCGCSGVYAQSLASCLATQCASACGGGPATGPSCSATEVECPGDASCACDAAGTACLDDAPTTCCSGTCTGGTCE